MYIALRRVGIACLMAMLMVTVTQAQENSGTIHIVQAEDTLFKIAEKYLGDGYRYPEIVTATQTQQAQDSTFANVQDANQIEIGDKLFIPTTTSITPTIEVSTVDTTINKPALATQPNIPTGQIAFSFWNNSPERCTYEINIIDVSACLSSAETCQATRRIFSWDNSSEPALSPDGTRLAFRGWGGIPDETKPGHPHPYKNCSPRSADRFIQTSTLDGTDIRQMTAFYEDGHPDWSPDGTRLLFDTARLGDEITRIMFIYTDTTGEDHKTVQAEDLRIAGQHPSWAPDNDRFVYRGCDLTGNRCGLWLGRAIPAQAWDAGTNMLGPIVEGPEVMQPDWSPLTDDILYQAPTDGNWDIYRVNLSDKNPQRLTSSTNVEGLPTWSPNGEWIAYLSNVNNNWGIWIMRADGTEPQQIFTFDGGLFEIPKVIEPYGQRNWYDEQISWSN